MMIFHPKIDAIQPYSRHAEGSQRVASNWSIVVHAGLIDVYDAICYTEEQYLNIFNGIV